MSDLQRYVSEELTHFTGRDKPDEDSYGLLVKIIKEELLTYPPHDKSGNLPPISIINGEANFSSNKMINPDCVCFCDIPVNDLRIHMKKYGKFGLSFSKNFLISHGANPVFYNALNSLCGSIERGRYFNGQMSKFNELFNQWLREKDQDKVSLYQFLYYDILSFFQFFDDKKNEVDFENYYMEREWRVIGDLKFKIEDIQRVIIPKEFSGRFREDVGNYYGQITFAD